MDSASLDCFYPTRKVTGPMTREALVKKIKARGDDVIFRRDLLYRLLALDANNLDMM